MEISSNNSLLRLLRLSKYVSMGFWTCEQSYVGDGSAQFALFEMGVFFAMDQVTANE
jgi:hypothetical protein